MIDYRIFQLCEQISNTIAHNWTIEEMAEKLNMSKPHFQKLFKSEMKMSSYAFLQEERLKKAVGLLETEDEQIKEIAYKVGMLHQRHFSHNFKKRFGKTPTVYRRDFREIEQAEIVFGQK